MKLRELTEHWEQTAKGQLTERAYGVHLDIESAARLAALAEMYPKRTQEELLSELIRAALEELEASFPYVKGEMIQATDELGDPIYQDVGTTPRFLELARKHLHRLQSQQSV
ncbi:pilin assembly protein [Pseudomonas sp. Marseille-QA0892]